MNTIKNAPPKRSYAERVKNIFSEKIVGK